MLLADEPFGIGIGETVVGRWELRLGVCHRPKDYPTDRPENPSEIRRRDASRPTTVSRADIFEDTDPEAVLRAAGMGERWALAALFRTYQPRLIRYLRGQEPTVADDLAGEVWIAVARGLDGFEGDERGFRSWLFTTARSRLVDHRRKAVRRRTDPVPHDRLDRPDRRADGGDPAAAVVRRLGAQEAVDQLVAGLTSQQAEAVLLRVVAGLDVGEVAHVMGRTPGSVRVLCHRALRRLADRFAQKVPEW